MNFELDSLEVRLSEADRKALALDIAELLGGQQTNGYLDVAAAAEFLSCSKDRIYTLVSTGRIPHYKDGSRTLFKASELDTYVQNGGAKCP